MNEAIPGANQMTDGTAAPVEHLHVGRRLRSRSVLVIRAIAAVLVVRVVAEGVAWLVYSDRFDFSRPIADGLMPGREETPFAAYSALMSRSLGSFALVAVASFGIPLLLHRQKQVTTEQEDPFSRVLLLFGVWFSISLLAAVAMRVLTPASRTVYTDWYADFVVQGKAPWLLSATVASLFVAAAICAWALFGLPITPTSMVSPPRSMRWGIVLGLAGVLVVPILRTSEVGIRGMLMGALLAALVINQGALRQLRMTVPGALLVLLGLFAVGVWSIGQPKVASDPLLLVWSDAHVASVLGEGIAQSADPLKGSVRNLNAYGRSPTLLTSLTLSFAAGSPATTDALLVTRVSQLLLSVLLVMTLRIVAPLSWAPLAVVGLVASGVNGLLGNSMLFPNHSGVRYFPFAAALLLIAIAARRRSVSPWGLGAIAGLTFFLSSAFGVVAFAGAGVYLLLAHPAPPSVRGAAQLLVRTGASAMAAILALVALEAAITADSLWTAVPAGLALSFRVMMSTGAVRVAVPEAPAVLAITGCIIILLRLSLDRRAGPIDPMRSFSGASAAMLLVWSVYYLRFVDSLTFQFLFAVLVLAIAPWLGAVRWAQSPRLGRTTTLLILAVAASLGGGLATGVDVAVRDIRQHRGAVLEHGCAPEWRLRPELCYPTSITEALHDLLDPLRSVDPSTAVVVSTLSSEMLHQGFNHAFPWDDLLWSAKTAADMDAAVRWLEESEMLAVHIEGSKSFFVLSGAPHLTMFADLHRRLDASPHFELRVGSGIWNVFDRVAPPHSQTSPVRQ